MGSSFQMKKIFFTFVIMNIFLFFLVYALNQKFFLADFMPYFSSLGSALWFRVIFGTYLTQTIFALVILILLLKLFNFDAIKENPILMYLLFCLIGFFWGTIRLNQTICISDNCKIGFAKVAYLNGNWFEGEVENNKPHGNGILYFKDGSIYKGSMFEGSIHGNGELKTSEYTMIGGWYKGKKSGLASFKYADGREEKFNYKDDKVIE